MSDLSQKLASLSPEKRKLLELKLKQQGKSFNIFPLSYAQQRLWFIDQLEPGNPAYNIPFAVKLKGKLNLQAVEKSLQLISARHEILRTTFTNIEGRGMQVIHPVSKINLEQVDLSKWHGIQQIENLNQIIRDKALFAFDLNKGPLGNITLIKMGAQEHVLLLVLHHIICDGWSMGVLINEFTQFYQRICEHKDSTLPALKIQYADFAQWQRNWLKDERLTNQLSYWKSQLGANPPVLALPTDKPRPAINRNQGDNVKAFFAKELLIQIQDLSRTESTTSFMTLLAAFNILLARYADQDDICIGIPIANRTRADLETLIGFFVNTLVIRADLSGQPSFREFLSRLKETSLNAYANQDLPFEMLVEELQPVRDMSHTPLFQVMFSHQIETPFETPLKDLVISRIEFENPTAKFDLLFNLAETNDGLWASVDYNTDLFNASTIERMLKHFEILLSGLVSNPEASINSIPLLDKKELHLLTEDWNRLTIPFPEEQHIARLFEEKARNYPDHLAVFYEGKSLSCGELNARANQLAHFLIQSGLKIEDLVGILLDRSVEMIISLLAVLKAGGAYLPLDPTYPRERLLYMLEDSGASILITNKKEYPDFEAIKLTTVDLKSDWNEISQNSKENLNSDISSQNLAYVIYTSGSTGRPKGVMIQHRSALNLAENLNEVVYSKYDYRPLRISLNAPISFDASVQQIVMLTKGHALYIIPQEIRGDGQALLNYVTQHKLEVLDCVPAQLRFLIAHGLLTNSAWKPLALLPGGEAIDQSTWAAMVSCQEIEFYNMYGPTECTVDSTIFDVKQNTEKPVIGRPVANAQFYVLDQSLQPCPIGVPGELYIGGAGLGRGYLKRPELTAEKFIPNPFPGAGGSRLYRSGDLARYLEDGTVEFLGRIDHQVKVRGFRIELGEIEAALEKHQSIKDAVVLIKTVSTDDKRLIAYLVPKNQEIPGLQELRDFLLNQLPDYMVPSKFIRLEKLPLNPSGKVDRKALLESTEFGIALEQEFLAPRTVTEEILSKIFREVLQMESISITDNFFDLGGHSLLATQVISRIREQLAVDIPLRELFHSPSVEHLAQAIEHKRLSEKGIEYKPVQKIKGEQELILSFAQQRLWFLDQMQPGSPFYNIPSAVRISGKLNLKALKLSLNRILDRHEILRTAIATVQGKPRIDIQAQISVNLNEIDLSHQSADSQKIEIQHLAIEEAQKPFQLDTAPLLRTTLISLAAEEHLFLLTMHHIVSDGWSTGIFIKEIAALYNAEVNGELLKLPALPVQYVDFAHWQREWLRDAVLESQLTYWKKQLSDAPPLLELPVDQPRPSVQSFKGARIKFELAADLSHQIDRLCTNQGVTHFMFLMAAFQILLARYSGQTDICVGSPVANRNRVEIEPLIGFFVNTLVIRTSFADNPNFNKLLRQVRKNALDAYANQDIPFEKILDALSIKREVSHSPLFQVMFALQNPSKSVIKIPGLNFTAFEMETATSKFDLSVEMGADADGIFKGAFEYNTDLFYEYTVQQMIAHFKRLLNEIIKTPDIPVLNLPLLSDQEFTQIVHSFNTTQTNYPHYKTLHQLFEEQVKRTPQATALVFKNKKMSYDELNKRANQLAHLLIKNRTKMEEIVGLYLEKSFEMVIGILGILKAGCAYVPIDPNIPPQRLAYIIKDTAMEVILSQQKFTAKLKDHKIKILNLDQDWQSISNHSHDNPCIKIDASNLAYVIYTSGSTGNPKGVMVQHQSIINNAFFYKNVYNILPKDRIMQYFNYTFDGSVGDFYMSLFSGACLYIPETEKLIPDSVLINFIKDNKISLAVVPPSLLSILPSVNFPDLRGLGSGGDICTPELARTWSQGRKYYNLYGPTETTVCCTHYLNNELPEKAISVPIGKPLPNFKLYILDKQFKPVPIGVLGELYIGGDGVTRGYLNRPDLTAEKFIPDPFYGIEGSRMYETGDLCRFLPDGNIEFHGRKDFQVKIRGFRIELGEIEAKLLDHPEIDEVVVVSKLMAENYQLVAYVVKKPASSISGHDLKEYLNDKIPEYMIPAYFMFLDSMPVSSAGKIDRKQLPEPEYIRSEADGAYIEAQTEIEKTLSEIWQQLLGLKKIGIHDNFFKLGGDSILSIQVIARAREQGLQINPVDLFKYQTIAQLATVVSSAKKIEAEQGEVSGELPLTPIQRWFFEQNFQNLNHWNQSLMFQVTETIEEEPLKLIIGKLLSHHDALRLRFENRSTCWIQKMETIDEQIPLHYFRLSDLPEKDQKSFVHNQAAELQASLDIVKGPLIKIGYFNRGSKADLLLLIIHHLAIDGVSWRILLEDFQTAYHQLKNGSEIVLPLKTTSFKSWAEQLSVYAQTDTSKSQLAYWQNIEQKNYQVMSLDFKDGQNSEDSIDNVGVSMDSMRTQALIKEIHTVYNTQINDILLVALLKSYERWSGKRSLLIAMEGHGREQIIENADISRTVGWFTTLYPVFLELGRAISTAEAIKTIKEQLRQIPVNGLGYGLLRYLTNETKLSAADKAEITFNYLGQVDQALPNQSIFALSNEDKGYDRGLKNNRVSKIDITGNIAGGKLYLNFIFSKNLHRKESIQALAQAYMSELAVIIDHCKSPQAGGVTASDFKLANLDDKKLDEVLSKLKKTQKR